MVNPWLINLQSSFFRDKALREIELKTRGIFFIYKQIT